jgi:hypothetical protein
MNYERCGSALGVDSDVDILHTNKIEFSSSSLSSFPVNVK